MENCEYTTKKKKKEKKIYNHFWPEYTLYTRDCFYRLMEDTYNLGGSTGLESGHGSLLCLFCYRVLS